MFRDWDTLEEFRLGWDVADDTDFDETNTGETTLNTPEFPPTVTHDKLEVAIAVTDVPVTPPPPSVFMTALMVLAGKEAENSAITFPTLSPSIAIPAVAVAWASRSALWTDPSLLVLDFLSAADFFC